MKRLIEIETGKIVSEDTFKKAHKNVLFGGGISEEVAQSFGYSIVLNDPKPNYEELSHDIKTSVVEEREDRWYQTWRVIQRPDADSRVRDKRNQLLGDTDWIVTRAYERNENIPSEWEIYRQALRDVPQQEGFPQNVVWPVKPE